MGIRKALKEVGFWAFDAEPLELVDKTWDLDERLAVIRYIKTNGRVAERYMGDSWCRFGCYDGQMHPEMGSADVTDGTWLWPEGYLHYVEWHKVKPPQEFIDHVLSQ